LPAQIFSKTIQRSNYRKSSILRKKQNGKHQIIQYSDSFTIQHNAELKWRFRLSNDSKMTHFLTIKSTQGTRGVNPKEETIPHWSWNKDYISSIILHRQLVQTWKRSCVLGQRVYYHQWDQPIKSNCFFSIFFFLSSIHKHILHV
jgi:hypothetical protein